MVSVSESKRRPRSCTEDELAKVGVNVLEPYYKGEPLPQAPLLECQMCGEMWGPNLLPNGRLPSDYWKCPKGCDVSRVEE